MNRRILGGEEADRFAVLPERPDRWARFVTLRKQSATVWKPIGGMTGAAPRHRDVPATAAPDPPRPAPHRSETQLRERRRGRPQARDRRKRAPWSRDTAESFRGLALLLENVTRGCSPNPRPRSPSVPETASCAPPCRSPASKGPPFWCCNPPSPKPRRERPPRGRRAPRSAPHPRPSRLGRAAA